MSGSPHHGWIAQWQKFRAQDQRDEMPLYGSLRLQVQADLYPLTLRILFKIFSLFLISATISYYAFLYLKLGWFFSLFGQNGSIFLRGFAFETVNLWLTGLFLTPEQMTAVSSRRIIILLSFIALSFVCYAVVTFRPWDVFSWLWLFGAIVAAMAQANMLFPISQQ
jgi:hypothetical protein